MAAIGCHDPDISGRDNPRPMLCLDNGAAVCPVWHTFNGRQECANRRVIPTLRRSGCLRRPIELAPVEQKHLIVPR
jgi:hypothetical protein